MLVKDPFHIELLDGFVDLKSFCGQRVDEIDCVIVAGFEIAVCIGIRCISRQTEQRDLGLVCQRQDGIVVLHDDGAFLTFPDRDIFSGSGHLLDSCVVALETRGVFIRIGHKALCAENAVQRGTVSFRKRGTDGRDHKQGGHDRTQSPHDGGKFPCLHLSPP